MNDLTRGNGAAHLEKTTMAIYQFEAGDVVTLRSGGPLMTVESADRVPAEKPVVDKPAPPANAAKPTASGMGSSSATPVLVPAAREIGPSVACVWQNADGELARQKFAAGMLDLKETLKSHSGRQKVALKKQEAALAAEKEVDNRTAPAATPKA